MSDTIIGIDLGTTNSEVALVRGERVEVLEVADATQLFPSYVGLATDGALLVGESAKNQYTLYPERTIKSVKRSMGGDDRFSLGDRQYSPQEVSAIILRRLKEIAENRLGEPVSRAVITVPAFFSDAQRQATREAGEIAGLEVVRIINEPTAAALAYESDHQGRKRILIYDLGGGTFDVSVVNMEDQVMEVQSSHGNNHLGGDDFDRKVSEHILAHLREREGVDATGSPQALGRINRAAEAARIALSGQPFVIIEEEYLLEHRGNPIHLSLELSRDDYEEMIRAYIDETLGAVHTALDGAGLKVADIDEILLVGGATRTPLVRRRLEEELGQQPRHEVHPDLCVATGAAIQAAMIAGRPVGTVLVDVTPYTFGTAAIGELHGALYPHLFVPLIRKNTPIPVTESEVFYTSYDGQTIVEIGVYQGEDPDALNNTDIGRFRIEGLRDVSQGNQVIATFSLDLNGILQVSAREKETGLEKSITIENAIARFEAEEMEEARRHLDTLFQADAEETGETDTSLQRELTQARALIEKAERLLEQATPEDREDLVDLIEAVNDAVQGGDAGALHEPMEHLTDLIYFLET